MVGGNNFIATLFSPVALQDKIGGRLLFILEGFHQDFSLRRASSAKYLHNCPVTQQILLQ
jgi:hypothetical protein